MGSGGTLLLKNENVKALKNIFSIFREVSRSSTFSDTRPRDIFRDGNLANDQRCLTQTKRQDLFISLCHLIIAISRTCRYMQLTLKISSL